jgi:hypothetical protein
MPTGRTRLWHGGYPCSQIAAICRIRGAALATRNTKDFVNCYLRGSAVQLAGLRPSRCSLAYTPNAPPSW